MARVNSERRYTAVVNGRVAPVSYVNNNSGFTDAGLSRVSAGVYRLTLSQAINLSAPPRVEITGETPNGTRFAIGSYRWISTTVIEVITADVLGYGQYDCNFSIDLTDLF